MPSKKKNKKEEEDKEKSSQEKSVPVKRIIYAEIDDEVTVLSDKIKELKGPHVYIVVPKRSILFQSVVNLKILKRKASDDNKKIYLVTNDKNGIHLAQKVGVEVYNKANSEGKPALFSTEVDDEKLRITPLLATVNSVEEETPTRLKERKLSISEILKKRNFFKRDVEVSKIHMPKKSEPEKQKSRFVVVAPNKHALIGLVALSLTILLFIIYVALPGATIYLTPAASVLERSVNITLADSQKNRAFLETRPPHTVESFPISTTVEKEITYTSTGKKLSDRGSNSSGAITIFNTSGNTWPLIEKTRFQTDEGIVFRINTPLSVPPATVDGPGTVEAFVVADQVDAYGDVIGERGNIEPSRFFLPGLRESSRSVIFAESKEPMTGGVTDFITFISAEDLDGARKKLNDELLNNAVDDLRSAVEDVNRLGGRNVTYKLLEGDRAVRIGEVKINIDSGLQGREVSEFKASGSVDVSGIYYNYDTMLAILTDELTLRKSPQKELIRINEDSINYRIFERDEAGGRIKLTANIRAIEQFIIDPTKESGANLIQRIQERVAGQNVEQAKLYIQNLVEVSNVEIESWPYWAPTVPNLSDNIKFVVRSALD
jgi:hypothetical protein